MKRKDFFEKLNNELDSITPRLSEELKSLPITTCENSSESEKQMVDEKQTARKGFFSKFAWQKLTAFATVILLSVIAVFSVINVSIANKGVVVKENGRTIVTVDINPSFSILTDKDQKIISVKSNNPDGDVVLSDEEFVESLIEKNLSTGISKVAERSFKLGFLDTAKEKTEDGKSIIRLKYSAEKELPENFFENIKTEVAENLKKVGSNVYIEYAKESVENFSSAFESIKNSAVLYYRQIKDDVENLREYAKKTTYEYFQANLVNALNEYDLYLEISELNKKIAASEFNINKDNYWVLAGEEPSELHEDIEKMNELLEKLYDIYGADLRGTGFLAGNANKAEMDFFLKRKSLYNIDALRELEKKGIDETFFELDNDKIGNCMFFIGGSVLQDLKEQLAKLIVLKVDEIVHNIDIIYDDLGSIRERIYKYDNYQLNNKNIA